MNTLFVKKLTTLDFSLLCPKRGLVGETWIIDLYLSGELNAQGMVLDFGDVKKKLKIIVDAFADHRLLVPLLSSDVNVIKDKKNYNVTFKSQQGEINCNAPVCAINPLETKEITIDSVKPMIEAYAKKNLPENISNISLDIYTELIPTSFFHYSHGLKKHLGDCQRIAHGHRSRIEIYLNEIRYYNLEQEWAKIWSHIYFVTSEDIVDEYTVNSINYLKIKYTAQQGIFELSIQKNNCYIINTDTTIEYLCAHLARKIKDEYNKKKVKVMLYEGVNKGAIAHL